MKTWTLGLGLALLVTGLAHAQPLQGSAFADALKQGGYVLVMRHAKSPPSPPAPGAAAPDNVKGERQLDAEGESTAIAMGAAIRTMRLKVGRVWSSPTYRALETARLAGLPHPLVARELGDNGRSMQATSGAQSAWLRAHAAESPRAGTDTFIVTQYPNITAAFGQLAAGMGDGEALVLHPDRKRGSDPVGRIRIEDWPSLARP